MACFFGQVPPSDEPTQPNANSHVKSSTVMQRPVDEFVGNKFPWPRNRAVGLWWQPQPLEFPDYHRCACQPGCGSGRLRASLSSQPTDGDVGAQQAPLVSRQDQVETNMNLLKAWIPDLGQTSHPTFVFENTNLSQHWAISFPYSPYEMSEQQLSRHQRRLRKRHNRMTKARDLVLVRREELQIGIEDLTTCLERCGLSQQTLFDILDDEARDTTGQRDHVYLRSVYEKARQDAKLFDEQAEKVEHLSNGIIEPEAQLIVADDDFANAANALLKFLLGGKRAKGRVTSTHKHTSQPPEEAEQSLLSDLRIRKSEINMFQERLNELNWTLDGDVQYREMILDRGELPQLSEREFFSEYLATRNDIERDLRQAHANFARMEEVCLAKGLDVMSLSDTDDFDEASHVEGEQKEHPNLGDLQEPTEVTSQDHHPSNEGSKVPATDIAWSVLSNAGSDPKRAPSGQAVRIDDWLNHTQAGLEKTLGIGEGPDVSVYSPTSEGEALLEAVQHPPTEID